VLVLGLNLFHSDASAALLHDGEIVAGSSALDESMLTGESRPGDKCVGDTVIGGTINRTGAFRYLATNLVADSVLARRAEVLKPAEPLVTDRRGAGDDWEIRRRCAWTSPRSLGWNEEGRPGSDEHAAPDRGAPAATGTTGPAARCWAIQTATYSSICTRVLP
jgi:magnesium-transporting ATPase (P-type)